MSKAWFAHKRFGYGAGLPIRWEGWAVLVAFFVATWALLYLSKTLLPPAEMTIARIGGIAVLLAALVAITRVKTEGGWRWRNGNE